MFAFKRNEEPVSGKCPVSSRHSPGLSVVIATRIGIRGESDANCIGNYLCGLLKVIEFITSQTNERLTTQPEVGRNP
jgi:hypothetical protein